MARLKLVHKGAILVWMPLLFELIFVVILAMMLLRSNSQAESALRAADQSKTTSELSSTLVEMAMIVNRYAFHKYNPRLADEYSERLKHLNELAQHLKDCCAGDPDQLPLAIESEKQLASVMGELTELEQVMRGGPPSFSVITKIKTVRDQMEAKAKPFAEGIVRIGREADRIRDDAPEVSAQNLQIMFGVLVGGLGLNFVLTLFLGGFFHRSILSKLETMRDNSRRLAKGETLNAVLAGSDEIVQVDRAFHEMAERLNESARKERAFFEFAQDVICWFDQSDHVIRINPAAESAWGYDSETLIGTHISDIVLSEDLAVTEAMFLNVRSTAEPNASFEARVKRSDGTLSEVSWSIWYSAVEKSLFCLARDVTQKKRLERLKEEFLSMVSHEMRTPLTSILLSLQLVSDGVCGEVPENAATRLKSTERNVNRLIALINDLLDVEKLEAGHIPMELATIRVLEPIEKAIHSVEDFARQHEVRVVSEDVADMAIEADSDRIVQVIINLVSNAVKFSPKKSAVSISCIDLGDRAEFRITDCGRGIPEEFLDKIFDRYQQVKTSDGRRRAGTGLGLAIAKQIVESHGGQIGVRSKENEGSTFWFAIMKTQSEQTEDATTVGSLTRAVESPPSDSVDSL